eukprot:Tamp_05583.p1 GENE.Tamp_05583~~Tamp_05583.p1  ORF type:complete len:579 (+),score=43.85 Tamp_05583:629-2365(+)
MAQENADEASHCGEQPETPVTERTPGQQANQRQQESLQKELRAAEARRFRREHPACRRLTLGTFIRIFHRIEANARKKTQYQRRKQVQKSKANKKENENLVLEISGHKSDIGRGIRMTGGQAQESNDGSIAANRASHALNRVLECEAKKKTSAILSAWAQRMLFLPPSARSESKIISLEAELRKHHWLDDLPAEVLAVDGALRATIKAMRLQRAMPDENLVYQDDICDAFYVVVQGSVQQWVRKDGQNLPHNKDPNLYRGQQKPHHSHHHTHTSKYHDSQTSSGGQHIFDSSLVVGPQGATLIVIQQSQFELALRPVMEGVLRERALFIGSIYPFSTWTDDERMALAREVQEMHVDSNQLIVRQGSIANHFFIIYSGVVRIIKQIDVPTRSMTRVRVPMAPTVHNYHSNHPAPAEGCMRRSSIMDAGRQKLRVLGTDSTSFRSTMWRESLPPASRHLSYPKDPIHTAPFKVPKLGGLPPRAASARAASARPETRSTSARTLSARPGSSRPVSLIRASPTGSALSARGHRHVGSNASEAPPVRLNRIHQHMIAVRQNVTSADSLSSDFLRKWKSGPQVC